MQLDLVVLLLRLLGNKSDLILENRTVILLAVQKFSQKYFQVSRRLYI